MKQNMGTIDRVARVALAVGFASVWFLHFVTGIAGIVLLTLACVFLITSVVGACPCTIFLVLTAAAIKKPLSYSNKTLIDNSHYQGCC